MPKPTPTPGELHSYQIEAIVNAMADGDSELAAALQAMDEAELAEAFADDDEPKREVGESKRRGIRRK